MAMEQIADQVYFSAFDGKKFNRCSISIHLSLPATKEFATDEAVLSIVLGRGYRSCPDMTALTRKLAGLYGAELSVTTTVNGANRVLSAEIIGIKNQYALNGENLIEAYLEILYGVLFDPFLVDGTFDAQTVDIEKAQLRRDLESEIDNKRTYCIQQARRKFFQESPAGVERDGYLEQIDCVTPDSLLKAYQRILTQSRIDVLVVGDEEDALLAKKEAKRYLTSVERQPVPLNENCPMPRQTEQCFTEKFDTEQAKLCLLFTAAEQTKEISLAASRLAMYLFGGAPTSRLFANVREKKSLCYYCAATYSFTNGAMLVDSGIQPANVDALKQAVLQELTDLSQGNIGDEELEDCRRGLVCAIKGIGDSISSVVGWYYSELFRGLGVHTPEQAAADIQRVTKKEIAQVLGSMSLSVSYLLASKKGEQ